MKNKEKYKDEILRLFAEGPTSEICNFKRKYILKSHCEGVKCIACRLRVKEWMDEEYKEEIKLSDIERVVLENITGGYEWIARDKNDELFIFKDKPTKHFGDYRKDEWVEYGIGNHLFVCYNHLFKFIKWEDEEPYNIHNLLASYKKWGN